MSQVFNGTKMMFDGSASPAVRVDGKIYFIDELLQESSGHYFIPKRFFYASYPAAVPSAETDSDAGQSESAAHEAMHPSPGCAHPPSGQKELYALGHEVERTDVMYLVICIRGIADLH